MQELEAKAAIMADLLAAMQTEEAAKLDAQQQLATARDRAAALQVMPPWLLRLCLAPALRRCPDAAMMLYMMLYMMLTLAQSSVATRPCSYRAASVS